MTIIPAKFAPQIQAILRIVVGLVFLQHGLSKLIDFPFMQGLDQMPVALKWTAGTIETIGGLALLLGFQVRLAAFVLAGHAAVAYFMVHLPMGFFPALNHGEPLVLLCFACLYLASAGAGAFSLDGAKAATA